MRGHFGRRHRPKRGCTGTSNRRAGTRRVRCRRCADAVLLPYSGANERERIKSAGTKSSMNLAINLGVTTYALLLTVWLVGFSAGYLMRSYISHRRRLRARGSRRHGPPVTHRLVQPTEADFSTLVPRDARFQGRAASAREGQPSLPADAGSAAKVPLGAKARISIGD